MRNIKIGNLFKGDKVVWMILFLLCMVSIVEVFSASSVLTYKSQNYLKPITFHSFTIIAGVIVAIVMQNIPYNRYRLMIPFLTVFSAATLLWVLIVGAKIGDAGR
jgi:cell division protein FtsW